MDAFEEMNQALKGDCPDADDMLTDEQIDKAWLSADDFPTTYEHFRRHVARTIEAEVRKEQAEKIAELERQLEEARKDSEIVNWLSVQDYDHLVISHCVDCTHDGQIYVSGDNDKDNYGDTLRDAVLYAIAKEQP